MKRNPIYLTLLLAALLFACGEDDGADPVINVGAAPSLTASTDQLVLAREQADQTAARFSWDAVDYGFPAAVGYALAFDQPNNNFDSAAVVDVADQRGDTLTVGALNAIATQVGLTPGEAGTLVVRVVSRIQDPSGPVPSVAPVYSEPLTLTLTPYSTEPEPAFLYVPGAYQGWSPEEAPALRSNEDNGVYVGYITFPEDSDLEFKFTPQRNWDADYGGEAGALVPGGGNLAVAQPGTYRLQADLNELTWAAEPYSWGVIGDATVGGWDVDQDLTYDYERDVWTITTELTPGEIKFRLNDDWAVEYGDDDTSDDALDPAGANIPITEAGTYDIVLDLSSEVPTYSLTPSS